MATTSSPMTASQFDDQFIQWRERKGFKHRWYYTSNAL